MGIYDNVLQRIEDAKNYSDSAYDEAGSAYNDASNAQSYADDARSSAEQAMGALEDIQSELESMDVEREVTRDSIVEDLDEFIATYKQKIWALNETITGKNQKIEKLMTEVTIQADAIVSKNDEIASLKKELEAATYGPKPENAKI